MSDTFLKLHSWLTLNEAADCLREALGRSVSAADLLRMSLDGELWLSVLLPPGTKASLLEEQDGQVVQRPARIEGLAKVARDEAGKRQVQSEMHWHSGLPFISMAGTSGALVSQGGRLYRLKPDPGATGFSPRPPSSLPPDVRLGVAQADLQTLLSTLRERLQLPSTSPIEIPTADSSQGNTSEEGSEPPLPTRTRETLLLMIAALARAQGIDITKASKAGETIATLVSELGYERTSRGLANHLRDAAKLLSETKDD